MHCGLPFFPQWGSGKSFVASRWKLSASYCGFKSHWNLLPPWFLWTKDFSDFHYFTFCGIFFLKQADDNCKVQFVGNYFSFRATQFYPLSLSLPQEGKKTWTQEIKRFPFFKSILYFRQKQAHLWCSQGIAHW